MKPDFTPALKYLLNVISQTGTLRQGELIYFHLHTPNSRVIPLQSLIRFGRAHRRHTSDCESVNLILKASEHKQNAFLRIWHVRKAQSSMQMPGSEPRLSPSPLSCSQAMLSASQHLVFTSHPWLSGVGAHELLCSLWPFHGKAELGSRRWVLTTAETQRITPGC